MRIFHEEVPSWARGLLASNARLESGMKSIMASLADIQAAVAAEKTVEASVVALLTTLSADLQAAVASNDPAAMQAVVDGINANAAALSAAVTQNTPAAPVPAPAPIPIVEPTPTHASGDVAPPVIDPALPAA